MPALLRSEPTQAVGWESLAALRFALAVIVVAGHLKWFSNGTMPIVFALDLFSGKAAVVGFLLVSGYSIGSSLERNRHQFYRRRLLRIYPLYFFAVAYALAIECALGGSATVPGNSFHSLGWKTALGNFALVQTFLVKPISFDGPVWSLSIEVFYYLLAPFFARLSRKYLLILCAVSAICGLLPVRPEWGFAYMVASKLNAARYLWCWLLGFLLWRDRTAFTSARAMVPSPSRRPTVLATLTLEIAVGAALVAFGRDTREPLSVVTYLVSVGVIVLATRCVMPPNLGKALDYLGDLSYPLYLYHLPTFILVYTWVGVRSPWALVACAALVSMLAFHLIDRFLKQRYLVPWVMRKARQPVPVPSRVL